MSKALLAFILLASSGALAQSRCDVLFPAVTAGGEPGLGVSVTHENLDSVIDQLARFQLEIDSIVKDEDRVMALEDWRVKFKGLGLHQNAALKARYLARLEELRTGAPAKSDKDVREDTLVDQRAAAIGKWDQVAEVSALSEPGASFGGGAGKMVGHKNGQVTVVDLATGAPDSKYAVFSQTAKLVGRGSLFAATADGSYLAAVDGRHIEVWNAVTGTLKSAVVGADISQVRFSEDGTYLFTSSQIGIAYIHRTADMFELLRHSVSGASLNEKILVSPDGRYVYFNRDGHSTQPYDLQTGRFLHMGGDPWIYDIIDGYFTKDSKAFVFLGKRGAIYKFTFSNSSLDLVGQTDGVRRLFGDPSDSLLLTLEGPKQSRAYFIDTAKQVRIDDVEFAKLEKIHRSAEDGEWVFFTASPWNSMTATQLYAVNMRHRTVVRSELSSHFETIEKIVPAAGGNALYVKGRTISGQSGLYRIY